MATEVLRQTPCHNIPIKTYQMEVAGCTEHPAALLPDRGSKGTSRTSYRECNQIGRAQRRTLIGLTGSPSVEPYCEQSHSREVKTYEGEKQQVNLQQGTKKIPAMNRLLKTSKKLVKGITDEQGTPEHLYSHEVQKMTKKNISKDQELPPLPDRAIKGLKNPWVSPNGEPFHTVRLWEFENLYVLLKHDMWKRLAKHKIPHYIRTNPNQSIRVPMLKELCLDARLDLDEVEQSVRAVRFNFCGKLEDLTFPFSMNIYAWRVLCHIPGDGNVNNHKSFPELRWTQWPKKDEVRIEDIPPKKQRHMRNLLEFLSRFPGGQGNNVNYPKALTYAIMGTIPTLTFDDLKTTNFIDFILDLPKDYVDYKVQFLAAFIVDDGSVSGDISFHQKNIIILEKIMELCDQLEYDHSPYPPSRQERDGMHDFNLRLKGVRAFYNDLNDIQARNNWDPLLGLWHFDRSHENMVNNISDERMAQNELAIKVCVGILTILCEHEYRTTKQLRHDPKVYSITEKYSSKIFRDRLKSLDKLDLIHEVKRPDDKSYRPKHWAVPPNSDPKNLIKKFHSLFGNRSHSQSYERKYVTVEMTKAARARLKEKGIKPTPKKTAREIGCSRQVFYKRPDLRALFEDDKEE
ncbi:MAG: hypothetical protein ACXADY_07485 [Candidatus Hodarchaeales archaeon]